MESPLLDLQLPDALPAGAGVQALAATLAGMGVADDAVRRTSAVVGELIVEARAREIFSEATAAIRLSVEVAGDRLRIVVQDRRLPDVAMPTAERLSWQLARLGFVDDLQSRVDSSGNTTECEIALRPTGSQPVDADVASDDVGLIDDTTAAQVVVRQATPDDAAGIARLAFRVAGFAHNDRALYSQEALSARLASGELVSHIGVGPGGEIVGHVGLVFESDDVPAEWGRGLVDPRWRGRHIATMLGVASLTYAREQGLPFLWSEATTRHTVAQKGSRAAGGVEVGLLVGAVPGGVSMAGFANRLTGRGSLMPYAIPVVGGPTRTVHLPERHWPIYREIVERLGLERELVDPGSVSLSGATDLRVGVQSGFNAGRIAIIRSGEDGPQRVADEYLAMAASGLAVVYIDIGLHEPMAADIIRSAEANGFFWAALLPEARAEGDVLRMQRTGWVGVDTEHAEYESDFGWRMAEYVLSERARILAPAPGR